MVLGKNLHVEGRRGSLNSAFEQVIENYKTHDRANYSHVWLPKEVIQALRGTYSVGLVVVELSKSLGRARERIARLHDPLANNR